MLVRTVPVAVLTTFLTILLASPTSASLPPTLETTLSGQNLILDKVLRSPSISFHIESDGTLETNFTAQFEANSSEALLGWVFISPTRCNLELKRAQFEIFGYVTSWTSPTHRNYKEGDPSLDRTYSYGNETRTGDQQNVTYRFALGGPIRQMQSAYYSAANASIPQDSIPVIISGNIGITTNCGVQNSGATYFTDLRTSVELQMPTEIDLTVPQDATITFFSSNLVRLRPNDFWLLMPGSSSDSSVQRLYIQYDLTPFWLQSPSKDFIVGTVTGLLTALAIPFLSWIRNNRGKISEL